MLNLNEGHWQVDAPDIKKKPHIFSLIQYYELPMLPILHFYKLGVFSCKISYFCIHMYYGINQCCSVVNIKCVRAEVIIIG